MDRGAWKASPQGCKESDTIEATQHACRHKRYVYNLYVTEYNVLFFFVKKKVYNLYVTEYNVLFFFVKKKGL